MIIHLNHKIILLEQEPVQTQTAQEAKTTVLQDLPTITALVQVATIVAEDHQAVVVDHTVAVLAEAAEDPLVEVAEEDNHLFFL